MPRTKEICTKSGYKVPRKFWGQLIQKSIILPYLVDANNGNGCSNTLAHELDGRIKQFLWLKDNHKLNENAHQGLAFSPGHLEVKRRSLRLVIFEGVNKIASQQGNDTSGAHFIVFEEHRFINLFIRKH